MIDRLRAVALLVIAMAATRASASETVTYSYDALGRLTAASHSGSVNSGLQSSYSYDAAGNRAAVNVTGATSRSSRVVVVPLGGFKIIPIKSAQ